MPDHGTSQPPNLLGGRRQPWPPARRGDAPATGAPSRQAAHDVTVVLRTLAVICSPSLIISGPVPASVTTPRLR
jgi:hypothetical protein